MGHLAKNFMMEFDYYLEVDYFILNSENCFEMSDSKCYLEFVDSNLESDYYSEVAGSKLQMRVVEDFKTDVVEYFVESEYFGLD